MSAIRPLIGVTSADVASVGSKAARLGELTRRGYPVPGGFVITAEAAIEPDGNGHRAQTEAAYHELGAASVAVRSSATAEDLPSASFAGQHATFLNVRGTESLMRAVAGCRRSLFSVAAARYRARRGIGGDGVGMAVVVQKMVDARAAGVAFSANPVSGAASEVLVEAAFGLGEAVVAGEVSPDRYALDKATLAVVQRLVDEKPWAYYCDPDGDGTVRRAVAEPARPVLTDVEAAAIAALVREIEALFGAPQDVEWAIDEGGSLFVLQARPITALPGRG
jgi:phosphoenolpyruvate synthase/pyruvate phosphate dikinase